MRYRLFPSSRLLTAALVGLAVSIAPSHAAPDRQDVASMAAADITSLQRRLTDAGCYTGPLDGQPSEATKVAVAACPDQRPQLRIETGMHVAMIKRIGVDADCTLAATASHDKTVRLWSLPEGKLLRVLRGPIGAGDDGKVYAAAVSPNGRFVASQGLAAAYDEAGDSAHTITIFDAMTGSVVAGLGEFTMTIDHLAFSKDGRWLAATLGAGAGVRVFDASKWREVAADKDYEEDSYGAVFGPDGRLYTTSYDGKVRRYGPGPLFSKEREIKTRSGRRPSAIDIDLDGRRLAVGFTDSATIDFYEASKLDYREPAETRGVDNGALSSVAARGDGRAWLAGGSYWNADSIPGLLFDHDGRGLGQPLPLSLSTIMDLKSCRDGFVVAAADPAFGLLDASGGKRLWREGVTADMRDKIGDAFTISANAKQVRFGMRDGEATPVIFDLTNTKLTDSAVKPQSFNKPKTVGLRVTDWQNTTRPRLAGNAIFFDRDVTSRSLAVRPRNDGFVLGADFWLQSFDARGDRRWYSDISGGAFGVNLSADGRIVVAASGDGTIRWHRWSDGQELLALFVNKETKSWVAWTPTGYYSASPGAEDMIGWHVNRGWAQAADFFPASRFRDQFARPDIVEKVLDTLDEAEAVKQANAGRGTKIVSGSLTDRLPPVISIVSPVEGASAGSDLHVDYLVRSPSGLPVTSVEVLIDGRPAATARGLERVADDAPLKQCLVETRGLGRVATGANGCQGTMTVSLPPGAHEIGLFARAGDRIGEVVKIRLTRVAVAQTAKPRLYALVVGISAYGNKSYALNFAAKDAGDFAAALRNQRGGLYADVDVTVLTDGQATERAIRQGFERLSKKVTSQDVGLIYLAGHGVLDDRDRFYFLAADSDADSLQSTAIPRAAIADALDGLSGKALLFLDACHAGAVAGKAGSKSGIDINGVVNELTSSERGVVAFTASTGRQLSQENAEWNNGAFTKAVVEGLGLPGVRGKADLLGNGSITTSALDAYVTQRVAALTGGMQSPIMIRPSTVPDFALAANH